MTAHDPRTCGDCQSMIAQGGHRIIDLLGHAGYTAYAAHHEAPPWTEVREAWAQAAMATTGMWAPLDSFGDWAEANGYGNEHERDFGHGDLLAAFQAGANAAASDASRLNEAAIDKILDSPEHKRIIREVLGRRAAQAGNCAACWHLWTLHGPDGCYTVIRPGHSLDGERCPCEHAPDPFPDGCTCLELEDDRRSDDPDCPAHHPQSAPTDIELLKQAADKLWGCAKAALTVEHSLDKPYEEDPRWSTWTRWVERPAREAHDLAMVIRKRLRAEPVPDYRALLGKATSLLWDTGMPGNRQAAGELRASGGLEAL